METGIMPVLAIDTFRSTKIEAEIIDLIVSDNRAFFRSQQINDPEITVIEKRLILQDILNESMKKFLFRFGEFIDSPQHLEYFESIPQRPEDIYEIKYIIMDIRRKHNNRCKIMKNRRYAAMQKMIADNNCYFSEREMMARQPLLYDHLIGQYMTEAERKLRDDVDSNEMAFSDVLMEGIFKRQVADLRHKQQLEEMEDELCENMDETNIKEDLDDDNKIDEIKNPNAEAVFPQIPPSFKQHWGDFDDEPTSSEGIKRVDSRQHYITAEEKELLRQEFYGIMYSNFVSGNDPDFDYKTIDDNSEFDNIEQQNQDAEDRYFDADDDGNDENNDNNQINQLENIVDSNSSEDELDVYMKQINGENKI